MKLEEEENRKGAATGEFEMIFFLACFDSYSSQLFLILVCFALLVSWVGLYVESCCFFGSFSCCSC